MRTAVVFAFNPQNAGMYSVDLGALHFFSGLGWAVDFFCPTILNDAPTAGYGQMILRTLTDSRDLSGYDNVIYWGDFTTNPQYGLVDFTRKERQFGGVYDARKSFQRWVSCFLPKRLLDGNPRVFSFGQNFQSIWAAEKNINLQNLAPLYEHFDAILPRDSYSVEHLQSYFPRAANGNVRLGMDCAFLVNSHTGADKHQAASRPLRIGTLFGRSQLSNLDILSAQAERRGAQIEDLSGWLRLPSQNIHWSFASLLETIRGCDLIISDTYHLLINAMREGVAVQGVGVKSERQEKSVSDFKKRVLFADLGLSDLYLELENTTLTVELAEHLLQALDPKVATERQERIIQTVADNTGRYKSSLKDALL